MRPIDADALKEEIVKLCKRINANNGITVPTLAFTRIIDNTPTFESKQGEWLEYYGNGELEYMCSECSAKETNPKIARYCYFCGAKMNKKGGAE